MVSKYELVLSAVMELVWTGWRYHIQKADLTEYSVYISHKKKNV